MQLAITCAAVSHCAADTVPVLTVAFLRVQSDANILLLLMTEGPGCIVRPSDLQVPPDPGSWYHGHTHTHPYIHTHTNSNYHTS